MRNRRIVECPYHVGQCIYIPQMRRVSGVLQRLLADRADIHIFDRRMGKFLGVVKRRQTVKPIVQRQILPHPRIRARIGIGALRQMGFSQNAK